MHRAFHPIFRGLNEERIDEIIKTLEPFTADAGETIFREGEEPEGLYLIEEGQVQIYLAAYAFNRRPELGMIKGPGDYFGEMSLLDRRRHLGTVVVLDPVKGWLLTRDLFFGLADKEPMFVLNLARDVVSRTRQADSQLILELARAKTAAELFIDRMKAIIDTSQAINSTIELDHLLNNILKRAAHHTGAEKGTMYLVDHDTGELVSRVIQSDRTREIRLPMGKGIAGYVGATGVTVNIPDAYADKRFNPDVDRATGSRTTSMLTMPMLDQERQIVGVVQLLNKRNSEPFNREDEEFIQAMSVHASIAIRNAKMAEKMVRQESLAAVGNLAASIIHDIKSPMTVIRGYAQLLETMYPDAEGKRYLTAIEKQIDRLVGMTQEVLDFSRGQIKFQYTKQILSQFFTELIACIQDDLKTRNVELITDIPEETVEAVFDHMRISRVFYNLVNNAKDAMKDGGTLTVGIKDLEDKWSLTVKDTGTGIPEDILDEIFEPFRSFGKAHGTGLGLAITRKVIEQHKGTIDVESVIDHGTTFVLTFPKQVESK